MKQFDPDLHHRRSIRLNNYDYSQDGLYFVTICTHEQSLVFGNITDSNIVLSQCGENANKILETISSHFSNVILHEHIIMPNHIHGIIEIVGTTNQGAINRARTATETVAGGFAGTINPMLHENLSRVVRWYKGRTTYECRKLQKEFAWHRNYYEHIIRTEQDYIHIAQYIESNPTNWHEDRFFKS